MRAYYWLEDDVSTRPEFKPCQEHGRCCNHGWLIHGNNAGQYIYFTAGRWRFEGDLKIEPEPWLRELVTTITVQTEIFAPNLTPGLYDNPVGVERIEVRGNLPSKGSDYRAVELVGTDRQATLWALDSLKEGGLALCEDHSGKARVINWVLARRRLAFRIERLSHLIDRFLRKWSWTYEWLHPRSN